MAGRNGWAAEQEWAGRLGRREGELGRGLNRAEQLREARQIWRDLGAVKEDRLRLELVRVTRRIGLPQATPPKALRHLFATCLQEANVELLVRRELMGHSPGGSKGVGGLRMTAVYTHTRPETHRR